MRAVSFCDALLERSARLDVAPHARVAIGEPRRTLGRHRLEFHDWLLSERRNRCVGPQWFPSGVITTCKMLSYETTA